MPEEKRLRPARAASGRRAGTRPAPGQQLATGGSATAIPVVRRGIRRRAQQDLLIAEQEVGVEHIRLHVP